MFDRSWIRNCALAAVPVFLLLVRTANSAAPGPASPVLANGGMEDGATVPAHWRFEHGEGGQKRFSLAQPSQVTDLTSGKLIAESATTIDLQLQIGESRWFRLVPR